MDPLRDFRELVRSGDDAGLDELCFSVAACFRPADAIAAGRAALDQLALSVRDGDADGVCDAVFDRGGLRGDQADYYAPANSLLDEVLARRLGQPITLAVVAIEVGRRVGVPLVGVGLPGHFMLGDADGRVRDPFAAGALRSRDECAEIVARLHGGPPASFDERWLRPVGPLTIVARIAANLERALQLRGDGQGALTAIELRASIPGTLDGRTRRQLADALAEGGRFDRAAQVYDALADQFPDASGDLRRYADHLRARLN